MTAKLGNWLIYVGAINVLIGLCCFPAAFETHSDTSLLSLGVSFFGIGALFIGGGLYLKARMLQTQKNSGKGDAPPRTRGGCELCGSDVPVIQCRVHQLHMCSTCLAEHFDPRSCSYVPPTRRPAAKSAKGMARARGA